MGPGTDVGGRYRIERKVESHSSGRLWACRDLKSSTPVLLWHLPDDAFEDPAVLEELRVGVRAASALKHRAVLALHGLGKAPGGGYYVAQDGVDGVPLAAVIGAKRREGKSLSPRGALNVLSELAGALSSALPDLPHGALTSEAIHVSRSGQVKVADFGLVEGLRHLPGYFEGSSAIFVAPEVRSGAPPTAQSDVYSLGALLYLLVCAMRPQAKGTPAPSTLQSLLPEELDDLVARCMNDTPSGRPADARDFRSQLLAIVETFGTPSLPEGGEWPFDDELGIPRTMGKTTKPVSSTGLDPVTSGPMPATQPGAAAPSPPDIGGGDLFDNALGAASSPVPAEPSGGIARPASISGPPVMSDQIDLGSLLNDATASENQCWMVQKGGLDHGPFSARELGQQIFAGKVSPDDQVLNMDTGMRQRAVLWPEFSQIVEKAMEKRRQEQEQEALRRAETVEKGGRWVTYVIFAAIVVTLGLVIGGYFIYRHATRDHDVSLASGDDLIEGGDIHGIKTGAGILPMERSKRRRGRGRRRRGGGGGGGGLSAEEAMNQAVDYGNLSGGMSQLSVGQITSVMNRNVRRLAGCMSGQSGRVSLDIVINGDGSVAGVSVSGASGSARSCIASRARGIRFPSFSAPRMRASYFFEVGN